jgi:hypothetical protein
MDRANSTSGRVSVVQWAGSTVQAAHRRLPQPLTGERSGRSFRRSPLLSMVSAEIIETSLGDLLRKRVAVADGQLVGRPGPPQLQRTARGSPSRDRPAVCQIAIAPRELLGLLKLRLRLLTGRTGPLSTAWLAFHDRTTLTLRGIGSTATETATEDQESGDPGVLDVGIPAGGWRRLGDLNPGWA